MSDSFVLFEQRLQSACQRLTVVRREVFKAFQDSEPITMRELTLRCQLIDRVSIYRTVSLFEKLGIIQRLQIGWKYKLELTGEFIQHHHHLSCLRCGKVIPLVEDRAVEQNLERLAASHDFTPTDHQLEIRGYCTACADVQPRTSIRTKLSA